MDQKSYCIFFFYKWTQSIPCQSCLMIALIFCTMFRNHHKNVSVCYCGVFRCMHAFQRIAKWIIPHLFVMTTSWNCNSCKCIYTVFQATNLVCEHTLLAMLKQYYFLPYINIVTLNPTLNIPAFSVEPGETWLKSHSSRSSSLEKWSVWLNPNNTSIKLKRITSIVLGGGTKKRLLPCCSLCARHYVIIVFFFSLLSKIKYLQKNRLLFFSSTSFEMWTPPPNIFNLLNFTSLYFCSR